MVRAGAVVLICAASVITAAAAAAQGIAPDPRLTPGAVATSDRAALCGRDVQGRTYAQTHRTWSGRASTMKKYDVSPDEWRDYTDDDRVPVCGGGDNASALNHWAEPLLDAERKDRIEDQMCRSMCAGQISPQELQKYFLGEEWTAR